MRTQKFFVSGMKNQDARNNAIDMSRWEYREIARKTFPVNSLLIESIIASKIFVLDTRKYQKLFYKNFVKLHL